MSSKAHVLAWGKGDIAENLIVAGLKPVGGGYSAPVKKLKICARVTGSRSVSDSVSKKGYII